MSALIASALLFAAPEPVEYVPAARLDELSCVKAWEQLCAVSDNDFPSVLVSSDRVTVRPFMDDTELVFTVASARNDRWALVATLGDATIKAQMSFEAGGATYRGPDVVALMREEQGAPITLRLVKASVLRKQLTALRQQLVPTGKCQGLTSYRDDGKPAPCLNAAPRRKTP